MNAYSVCGAAITEAEVDALTGAYVFLYVRAHVWQGVYVCTRV